MIDSQKTRITNLRNEPPGPQAPACLVVIYAQEEHYLGRRYQLKARQQTIGRGPDCDIVMPLDSVSRRHAKIERRGSVIQLSDLGSTNGTYVNQKQISTPRALDDGDQIKVGNVIFKFLTGGNVEASYHEAIYRMTIVDGLTEAHNKRYLLDFLERELARCSRYGRSMSVVMFDLDHFKLVNDTYGHLAGDHVLREVASALRGRIRREELLARYGGEEFVVVLPESDHAGAMAFAEDIRLRVAESDIQFEGHRIRVTVSLGVATAQGTNTTTEELLKAADAKLYEAKRSGRNCVRGGVVFH